MRKLFKGRTAAAALAALLLLAAGLGEVHSRQRRARPSRRTNTPTARTTTPTQPAPTNSPSAEPKLVGGPALPALVFYVAWEAVGRGRRN